MIKILTIRFEEKEHHKLKTAKEKTNLTWERFFLSLVKGGRDGNNKD